MRLIDADDLIGKLTELEITNPNFVMADVKKLVFDSTTYAWTDGDYLNLELAKTLINCNKDYRLFTKEELDSMAKTIETAIKNLKI